MRASLVLDWRHCKRGQQRKGEGTGWGKVEEGGKGGGQLACRLSLRVVYFSTLPQPLQTPIHSEDEGRTD